jgi:diadenosine tetraphosphate (Ap4A) HIT family hydrolase
MIDKECKLCESISAYARSGEKNPRNVYDSEHCFATHSDKPYAEVHVFIATKKHIPTIFDFTDSDNEIALDVMKAIQAAANEVIALKGACKLEMYLGELQSKPNHFHCHVIYDKTID